MTIHSLPNRQPWWSRLKGMFNLNDPRWGRDEDSSGRDDNRDRGRDAAPDNGDRPEDRGGRQFPNRPQGSNQGPPDLDELWRDFNRKLGGMLGGGGGRGGRGGMGGNSGGGGGGGMPSFNPDPKSTGIGAGLIVAVAALIWLGTGFFIVQEGQQAVVTQFGRYHSTVGAGFNYRLPTPIQRHETVFVTQIRSVDVGRDSLIRATGLRDSAMLTKDENIVEIKFTVQYRLSNARDFLFNSRDPDAAVLRAAETAVREVVGSMTMDAALVDERDQIGPRVRILMQNILDRNAIGIEVVGINLQQGGVRPPEQVQAAFDDVLMAGQERERARNEAQAYANNVIPRARGAAARLREEAEGYRARIVASAEGDAERFRLVQAEHARAPQVTRERLYIETMQEIFSNVTKVFVDNRNNSNLLFLPLDKLLQSAGAQAPAPSANLPGGMTGSNPPPALPNDPRARDDRARSRDVR
ncbi:MAG: FtsH protease activity modulator HflK [Burkholderiaceae bacterium]|nr:FtsH protease activity modulator HflK [Burkholderiaceae bacterium]